jgi:hypothetical protein
MTLRGKPLGARAGILQRHDTPLYIAFLVPCELNGRESKVLFVASKRRSVCHFHLGWPNYLLSGEDPSDDGTSSQRISYTMYQ